MLDVAGIYRCASWNRGEAVSKRRPHKSRALIDERNREEFAAPEMATDARKMARVTLLN